MEKWGAKKEDHPEHREAYILILSSNCEYNWWEYIRNPQTYFKKKYNRTISSCKTNERSKKRKNTKITKKKHKNKQKKAQSHGVFGSKPEFVTDSQFELLRSFGGNNVFFQRKVAEGKGPILLKGWLPKMKPVPNTVK